MPQYNEGFVSKYLLEGCSVPLPRCKRMALCVREVREGCGRDPVACEVFAQRAITMTLEDISMTPLKEASVEFIHPKDPSLSGASAVTVIAESHGAIHTWGESGAVRVVVDSCRTYDISRVADMLCFLFSPVSCSVWVEERELRGLRRLKDLIRIHGRTEYRVGLVTRLVTFLKKQKGRGR